MSRTGWNSVDGTTSMPCIEIGTKVQAEIKLPNRHFYIGIPYTYLLQYIFKHSHSHIYDLTAWE